MSIPKSYSNQGEARTSYCWQDGKSKTKTKQLILPWTPGRKVRTVINRKPGTMLPTPRNALRLDASKTVRVLVRVDIRELLLQRHQLRLVVDHDVQLIRVLLEVVLMVVLGSVESTQFCNLRHDRPRESPGRR